MRSLRHEGKAMKPSLSFLALGKRKGEQTLSGIQIGRELETKTELSRFCLYKRSNQLF